MAKKVDKDVFISLRRRMIPSGIEFFVSSSNQEITRYLDLSISEIGSPARWAQVDSLKKQVLESYGGVNIRATVRCKTQENFENFNLIKESLYDIFNFCNIMNLKCKIDLGLGGRLSGKFRGITYDKLIEELDELFEELEKGGTK